MCLSPRYALESKGSSVPGVRIKISCSETKFSKVYIDVDCSQFNYSTPVSSFVNKTLELEKIRRQGYRNEKEQLEKLRLLAPGLDDLKLRLNVCNFYGGVGLSGRTGPIGFPGKRYPLLEERCYMIN